MKVNARVMLAKCSYNKLYGIRVEQNENKWLMTWAFPLDEKKAHSEGYNKTQLTGDFEPAEKYNGCPYCGAKYFVLCGSCGKISCYNNEKKVKCNWCGVSGEASMKNDFSLEAGSM